MLSNEVFYHNYQFTYTDVQFKIIINNDSKLTNKKGTSILNSNPRYRKSYYLTWVQCLLNILN